MEHFTVPGWATHRMKFKMHPFGLKQFYSTRKNLQRGRAILLELGTIFLRNLD
jgi:hypothetical protein